MEWDEVLARIEAVVELEATARGSGALQRVRKIKRASDLLRLCLFYGPGRLSLREAAAAAGCAGIAELSDKAVLGRLRRCGDWLELILRELLAALRGDLAAVGQSDRLRLALVDGTVICGPGSKGPDWRVHARYDPAVGRFLDLVVSTGRVGEKIQHTALDAGTTLIVDRGYARAEQIRAALAAQCQFVGRIGWRSLSLRHAESDRKFDLMEHLPEGAGPVEHRVRLRGHQQPLRLVIEALPPEAVAAAEKRVTRRESRSGKTMMAGTKKAAGYLFLLTTLPAEVTPAERVVALYRSRWQVELGFKRLKTLGGIGDLPATDPRLARTWLLAHLIAAVLTEDIATQMAAFSPCDGEEEGAKALPLPLAGMEDCPPSGRRSDPPATQTTPPGP